KFIESFNKRFDGEVRVAKDIDAEYTMKIHSTMMWAGYNVGIVRKNAKLEATVSVYKTSNPSEVLWSANYTKVEGSGAMGYDFDSGYRITEAYAKIAKEVAHNIKKKASKPYSHNRSIYKSRTLANVLTNRMCFFTNGLVSSQT